MELKSTLWIFAILALCVAQDDRFMRTRQQFAWDLFKNTKMPKNSIISPLSLDFVINLMFLGTTKTTFYEVKNGLGYPRKFTEKSIEDNLMKWSKAVKDINGVELATKIYINNTVKIRNKYKLTVRKILNSDIEKIAFIKSKPATKKINKWISNMTHDLIPDMLGPGVINQETLMVLINCIYFGGKWSSPFIKDFTYLANFTTIDGDSNTIDFMYQDSTLDYSHSVSTLNGAAAVSLSYFNTTATMLFVLPPNDTDFWTWQAGIQSINWTAVDASLKPTSIKFSIPKFNITFDKDMKDTLKNMSFKEMFEDEAHMEKIFLENKAQVENLLHKAILRVDEIGTVAAGVAGMDTGTEVNMSWKTFLWIFGLLSIGTAQDATFMKSRQQFAWELFQHSREELNVIMSPISMDYVLNVMFLGATQYTFTIMKIGLQYPQKYSLKLIQNNLKLWTSSNAAIPGVEMVTKLYVNSSVQMMSNYTSLIKKSLNCSWERIEFTKSIQAAKKINDWIAKNTHNLIQNLIPTRAFDNHTKLLIANCIYFKSNWQVPFKKSLTFSGTFNAYDGSSIPVSYMTRTGFYNYNPNSTELHGASVVSIDYKRSNASMLFILPPTNIHIEAWLEGIETVDWNAVQGSLYNANLNVTVPKFNFTYLRDMTGALAEMNMFNLFDSNATFDKMFMPSSRNDPKFCAIIQKAVISIDEEGTVAAAVSVAMMGSGRPTTPPIFFANRPFFFVIRNGPTILFMGQYYGINKAFVNLT
ncbi:alaserpin-like [Chironomus tepperi]|uniref:alaserpin-like n=1 Tax=Chironomus tepperi TaxID=113505 RepID=UPI00391F910A